jgi:hypothetical protein
MTDAYFASVAAVVAKTDDTTEPVAVDSVAVTTPDDTEPAAVTP